MSSEAILKDVLITFRKLITKVFICTVVLWVLLFLTVCYQNNLRASQDKTPKTKLENLAPEKSNE